MFLVLRFAFVSTSPKGHKLYNTRKKAQNESILNVINLTQQGTKCSHRFIVDVLRTILHTLSQKWRMCPIKIIVRLWYKCISISMEGRYFVLILFLFITGSNSELHSHVPRNKAIMYEESLATISYSMCNTSFLRTTNGSNLKRYTRYECNEPSFTVCMSDRWWKELLEMFDSDRSSTRRTHDFKSEQPTYV